MIGRSWAWIAGLLGAVALAGGIAASAQVMDWSDLLSRPHAQYDARIAYGADPLQHVDLWLPRGKGPFPTVLMIHGGCWLTGIAQADIMDYAAADLRGRGIAVWNVEYRGVDRPGGGYPGTFADVAAATDALREAAPRYHLAIDRLVAFGHSAGGHLALWAASRGHLPKTSPLWHADPLPIATVISTGGLPDLERVRALSPNCGGQVLMDRLTDVERRGDPAAWRDTSPARMMPSPARQILVAAEQDGISPPALTTDYARKAAAAGAPARTVIVPGEGHVELIAPGSKAWATEVALIEEASGRSPKRR